MVISNVLLISNVKLKPINAPIISNRGILMAFRDANLDFAALCAYSYHNHTSVVRTLRQRALPQKHHGVYGNIANLLVVLQTP